MKLRSISFLRCGAALFVCACSNSTAPAPSAQASPPPVVDIRPQSPGLCARPRADAVRDVFCQAQPATIASLAELQTQLRVGNFGFPNDYSQDSLTRDSVVMLGHSTALSGHLVSPINPRAIMSGADGSLLLAFARGVQRVEIAARDRDDAVLDFYLVTFGQACNAADGGCSPGDLYTARVESDWLNVEIRDDEDLKNTPFDCRQCHERARSEPALLMRELESPWLHFFGAENSGDEGITSTGITGATLTADYLLAKGSESYAGFAPESVERATGYSLSVMVAMPQPLLFDDPTIVAERFPYVDGQAWPGPPQRSAHWDQAYAAFKRGEQLALPYFDAHATDPAKLAALTDAYQRYASNALDASDLPDLADIFPDDPQTRAEIGLQTEPNATPAESLIQACGSCHNDVLDQSISRAHFNVAVARLDGSERAVAIDRIGRGRDEVGAMPPAEARQLDTDARARLTAYLSAATFSDADRDMLERAAVLGMAGTAQP